MAKEGDDANLTLVDPQDADHTLGSNSFRFREVCVAGCMPDQLGARSVTR